MGTASLIFGLVAIGFGVVIVYDEIANFGSTDEISGLASLLAVGVAIILLAIGGFLLRKYDKDKKKEKVQG